MSATGEGAEAGTTLIEALVALTITTLVALIGFPRMQQGLLSLGRRETVAVVAARLRQARADALRADRPLVFAIGVDGKAFGVPGQTPANTAPGVELATKSNQVIVFYGDGSSSGGSIWVVAGRHSIPVLVNPATGAVSVAAG